MMNTIDIEKLAVWSKSLNIVFKNHCFALPKVVGLYRVCSWELVNIHVLSFFRMLFTENYRNRLTFHKVIQKIKRMLSWRFWAALYTYRKRETGRRNSITIIGRLCCAKRPCSDELSEEFIVKLHEKNYTLHVDQSEIVTSWANSRLDAELINNSHGADMRCVTEAGLLMQRTYVRHLCQPWVSGRSI